MLKFYQNKKEANECLHNLEKKVPDIFALVKDSNIVLASAENKELFLVSDEMLNFFNKARNKDRILFFGEYFGASNIPSFSALEKYSKLAQKRKVIVNQKGEQTFLYGFNLEKKFLVLFDKNLKIDDYVVVCNEHNESLGLGKIISDITSLNPEQKIVKNILDLGWYLRHKEGID